MYPKRGGVVAIGLMASLVACQQASEPSSVQSSECVDIPDGQYFQFVDGRLVSVASPEQQEADEPPPITARRIGESLAGQGFPWIVINWDGRIARIGGIAPDENNRTDGVRNAEAAFRNDPQTEGKVQRVVNEIEVRYLGDEVVSRMNNIFAAAGLNWLNIVVKGQVAILTGRAPNASIKREAYRRGLDAINRELNQDETAFVIVDAIVVPGQEEPVGEALLTLSENPSLIECDNAFFETMDDQSVAFISGEAIVDSSASKPLIDALSGIAHLCQDFEIEIRQHAAGPIEGVDVMDLSARRASAIRDDLSIHGARDSIISRGMGATNPLDPADTPAARARNQRTEFIVRDRED